MNCGVPVNKLEFVRRLDSGSERVSDATADLWYHLLSWVVKKGYADTADSPDFVSYVQEFRAVGVATINKHLSRMAEAKFLQRHRVARRLPPEIREDMSSPIHTLIFGSDLASLPTSFTRYTLPGVPCPTVFRSLERAAWNEQKVLAKFARDSA